MIWNNAEHYPDTTAAEAMIRVMYRSPEELDTLDDDGCHRLIGAVVRRAVEDHYNALKQLPDPAAARRAKETASFFRSEYFRLLTGLDGRKILELIRREAGRK